LQWLQITVNGFLPGEKAPSRGWLVRDFLCGRDKPWVHLDGSLEVRDGGLRISQGQLGHTAPIKALFQHSLVLVINRIGRQV
jgi:hypothetical protein